MTEDLVIHDAEVLDGTGSPAGRADVLVSRGVIVAVEEPGRLPTGEHQSIEGRRRHFHRRYFVRSIPRFLDPAPKSSPTPSF
ncbi:MAG: hypothetical protein JWO67_1151 [Streptosporangiaceae bacterium]|jgi:N-acyl-D-aspartate/D-glutamate deacylase|nr:hypothetical protein [Streptosporangiaceae bacterium]